MAGFNVPVFCATCGPFGVIVPAIAGQGMAACPQCGTAIEFTWEPVTADTGPGPEPPARFMD